MAWVPEMKPLPKTEADRLDPEVFWIDFDVVDIPCATAPFPFLVGVAGMIFELDFKDVVVFLHEPAVALVGRLGISKNLAFDTICKIKNFHLLISFLSFNFVIISY